MPRYVILILTLALPALTGADWLQFRGNQHNSIADANPPTSWDVESGKNIAWTADLPGRGPSSPIVVQDRVIVTASDGVRQDKLYVLAFDAQTGKELWRRRFWATGRTLCNPESAVAAPTPASDGERIFAFYSSNDLACLDVDGNLLWYRGLAYDYPQAGNDVGMSSSPVVAGETVVVQIESQGDSFAAGLDVQTGLERWRVQRAQRANWSSPVAFESATGWQVLLQSVEKLTAFDALTGKQLWDYKLASSEITSTVVAAGKLFAPANGVTALELSENSSAPKLLWDANKITTSGSTPVVYDGCVYALNRAGVLTCADAKTGDVLYQLRLKGPVWATPVIAAGRLYMVSSAGEARVVELGHPAAGDKGQVVFATEFGERIQGTPAVSGNALFIRSDKHLWKIAE
jgi:outer membrane protein assembly factor BamB